MAISVQEFMDRKTVDKSLEEDVDAELENNWPRRYTIDELLKEPSTLMKGTGEAVEDPKTGIATVDTGLTIPATPELHPETMGDPDTGAALAEGTPYGYQAWMGKTNLTEEEEFLKQEYERHADWKKLKYRADHGPLRKQTEKLLGIARKKRETPTQDLMPSRIELLKKYGADHPNYPIAFEHEITGIDKGLTTRDVALKYAKEMKGKDPSVVFADPVKGEPTFGGNWLKQTNRMSFEKGKFVPETISAGESIENINNHVEQLWIEKVREYVQNNPHNVLAHLIIGTEGKFSDTLNFMGNSFKAAVAQPAYATADMVKDGVRLFNFWAPTMVGYALHFDDITNALGIRKDKPNDGLWTDIVNLNYKTRTKNMDGLYNYIQQQERLQEKFDKLVVAEDLILFLEGSPDLQKIAEGANKNLVHGQKATSDLLKSLRDGIKIPKEEYSEALKILNFMGNYATFGYMRTGPEFVNQFIKNIRRQAIIRQVVKGTGRKFDSPDDRLSLAPTLVNN